MPANRTCARGAWPAGLRARSRRCKAKPVVEIQLGPQQCFVCRLVPSWSPSRATRRSRSSTCSGRSYARRAGPDPRRRRRLTTAQVSALGIDGRLIDGRPRRTEPPCGTRHCALLGSTTRAIMRADADGLERGLFGYSRLHGGAMYAAQWRGDPHGITRPRRAARSRRLPGGVRLASRAFGGSERGPASCRRRRASLDPATSPPPRDALPSRQRVLPAATAAGGTKAALLRGARLGGALIRPPFLALAIDSSRTSAPASGPGAHGRSGHHRLPSWTTERHSQRLGGAVLEDRLELVPCVRPGGDVVGHVDILLDTSPNFSSATLGSLRRSRLP